MLLWVYVGTEYGVVEHVDVGWYGMEAFVTEPSLDGWKMNAMTNCKEGVLWVDITHHEQCVH